PAECSTDAHPDARGIAPAEHIAGHPLPCNEQVRTRLPAGSHSRGFIDLEAQVCKRHAWLHYVSVIRRRIDGQRPVRLDWRDADGLTVIQNGVIERARATC